MGLIVTPRQAVPAETEKQVLVASRRRCCLCYFLKGIKSERPGQLAHVDHDPNRTLFEDLVWLCLEHHNEFDSKTSQAKGLKPLEVRHYRDQLYEEIDTQAPATAVTELASSQEQKGSLLESGHQELGQLAVEIKCDRSARRSPIFQEAVVLQIKVLDSREVRRCYGHVIEVLWDQEARFRGRVSNDGRVVSIDEESGVPIFRPLWNNHDIYLRWTGRSAIERYQDFRGAAVLEVAIDTWHDGSERAFLAAANEQAGVEYALYPGREYLITVEIGAENLQATKRHLRVSLMPNHLAAGLQGRRRLELEDAPEESASGLLTSE